jgi:fumarate reductase subunit C
MKQPRAYHRRVSTYWWLWQPSYLKFILRELTSVPVALFVVVTLLQIRALGRGPEAYAEFQQWLSRPHMVALHAVSFLFVVFHAVTWFSLAPRAMAIRVRGKRVPDLLIAGPNYAAWALLSAAVAWFVLGG